MKESKRVLLKKKNEDNPSRIPVLASVCILMLVLSTLNLHMSQSYGGDS
jgi:hypothetical protein